MLNILLITILSHIYIYIYILSPSCVTTYPVYTHKNLKFNNCIIKRNIVPFSYFPHVLLLQILYIIINCNIVSFLYFLYIKLIIVMYVHLQNLKNIKYIINCNIVPHIHIYIYIFSPPQVMLLL